MGVTWGIVKYPAEYDSEKLIAEWRPLASFPARTAYSVMRGNDRFDFLRLPERDANGSWGVKVTTEEAADMRAQIDALSTGDGTYDLFEQLFDGFEVFVPWRTIVGNIQAPGCPLDGKRRAGVDTLIASMRYHVADFEKTPPEDKYLARLAKELLAAGQVAKKLGMLIRISF